MIEKEKKKLAKIIKYFKKEKLDRATEKLAFGLSHSNEDKHILLFNPLGISFSCYSFFFFSFLFFFIKKLLYKLCVWIPHVLILFI